MKPTQSATPTMLKSTWTRDARTASRGLPIAARSAVTQVPTLAPRMRAMPAGRVKSPWLAIAITTAVVAEED
jgi:hypothetical protein